MVGDQIERVAVEVLLAAGGDVGSLVDPCPFSPAVNVRDLRILDEVLGDTEHEHGLVGDHPPLLDRGDGPVELGSHLEVEHSGVHLAAVEVLSSVEEPLHRPAGALGHHGRAVGAAQVPAHLAPAAEAGALIQAVQVDLVHRDAAEPSGDRPLADVGTLLLDPDLRVLAVPSPDATGPFRAYPGVLSRGVLELDDLVRLGEALLHVSVALDPCPAGIQVALGIVLRIGQRSARHYRFLDVEDERALLPFHPDQPQSLLGDLLAVGDHEGPDLFSLEMGYARQRRIAVELMPVKRRSLGQFGIVVAQHRPHARILLRLRGVHAGDLRMRIGRGEKTSVEHPRQLHVQGVLGRPGGLVVAVGATHLSSADAPELLQRVLVGPRVVEELVHPLLLVIAHGRHLPVEPRPRVVRRRPVARRPPAVRRRPAVQKLPPEWPRCVGDRSHTGRDCPPWLP